MKKNPPYAELLHQLEAALVQEPENVSLLLDLGFLYFEDAHISEKALFYFEKALSLDPKNVTIMHWIARIHYFERVDFDAARKILEKALKIDPNNPECFVLYSSLIREYLEGDLQTSFAYSKKAVEIAPNWPTSHCQLAIDFGRQGKWEEAEKELAITYKLLKSPPPPQKSDRENYFQQAVMGFAPPPYENTNLIARLIREGRI